MIREVSRSPEEWAAREYSVVATWSIFNPFGPTIWCLGLAGAARWRGTEVFCRCMNPFMDQTLVLGHLRLAGEGSFRRLVGRAFSDSGSKPEAALVTSIPGIVTFATGSPFERILPRAFPRSRAFRDADWGREMYYLGKYGAELFDRATEELRESLEDLRNERDPEARRHRVAAARERFASTVPDAADLFNYTPAPFSEDRLNHWWTVMTSERFVASAVPQLASAWVGAIHTTDRVISPLQFEDVRDFLQAGGHALWPEALTTESLAEGLGITN